MAREGMNVDQIANDGNQMKQMGDDGIPTLISAVESIVQQIEGTWHGADADSFRNAWQSTFKPNLTNIATAISTHGQLAVTNAQEQTTTSSAGSIA